MTMIQPSPTVFVTLYESTVAMLMALRAEGETLDAVAARCVQVARQASVATSAPVLAPPTPVEAASPSPVGGSTWPAATAGFYVASILGAPVGADTMGRLFRNVVDAIHDLDPAVIERLAGMKARTRRFAARAREDVHAGRRDLPVLQTRSGWWVSANIGRPDLVRGLRALCAAGGLRYGRDIRFPA